MTRAPRRAPRVLALVLGVAALAAARAVPAQEHSPDVPSGPATVVGRLFDEARPEAAAGIEVLLYALAPDGNAGLRQGRSDAEGRFRFEGVSNAPEIVYLVGARAGGVPFGTRFQFAPDELEHRVELEVSEASSDTGRAIAGELELHIERGCTHLHVEHVHALRNPGPEVLFVPEAQRAAATPIFEVELPAEAVGFESMAGSEGLVREERTVRFWGPLYPGSQTIEFGYGLPLDTASVRIGLSGASSLLLLSPRGQLAVSAAGLRSAPDVEVEGRPQAALRAAHLAPGTLELAIRSEGSGAAESASVHTPRAEMWLELDDAALEVNERLVLQVDGSEPVTSVGVPLVCLPLPPTATALRFSPQTLEAGLRRDPSGSLAVLGPLPSGESELALSYRLPANAEGAELVRRFDRELPLLSVLVADNGVITGTDRLHKRRAFQMDDRIYQHLEAFAVEPQETIEVSLTRTPPRGTYGRWASAGFAVCAGLAALVFLTGPLRGAPASRRSEPTRDPAALERDAIVRSLQDLDEDLETGKLSVADHAAMRQELRSRAATALLAAPAPPASAPTLESAPTAVRTAPVAAGPAPCAACGAAPAPGDRFCTRCGEALLCAACGVAVRPGDAYCSQCGAKLAGGARGA